MPERFADPGAVMRRALLLAARGKGFVEPNPQVGAVIVTDDLQVVAEGWHQRFGGPHAEVEAIRAAGPQAAGKTLFVTLEPCCHQGKTGPCTQAIIDAGIRKVIVAVPDPSPQANGSGIDRLRKAGIEVEIGLLGEEAAELIAPFVMRVTHGRPWVHAKWAMTLDGKIASRTGSSRWISSESSREKVHQLRGLMDAILIGSGTARRDHPLLTARPAGPRTATRIVIDTHASLEIDSQLLKTTDQAPLLIAVGEEAPGDRCRSLQDRGAEILVVPTIHALADDSPRVALSPLLQELGRRDMTNVLVEGGGELLGSFFDERLIDEVHVFIAPKLIGGSKSVTPLGGLGLAEMSEAARVDQLVVDTIGDDIYLRGFVRYS